MGEFFKYFGIAIAVLLVDVVISFGIVMVSRKWEDDDWLLGPLIVNMLWFAVVAAFLIGERIG